MNLPAEDRPWPTPRSVYLHVPFCRHRCGYCNFSVVAQRDDLMERFVRCIDQEVRSLDRPAVDTVFIGGGTPTHLPHGLLARMLQTVHDRFKLAANVEFSVEANPEDIESQKLAILAEYGVNRLSLGVQSFAAEKLRILERGHSRSLAIDVVHQAADRIKNISIDLIFATPGEMLDGWKQDLETACSLPISHLSTYNLTYEKGTSFWSRRNRGQLGALDDEAEIGQYQAARQIASQAGLKHYEVSNFAKPDARCRHNLAYWDGQGWFAAGPGAARFAAGRREVNHRSPTTYMKKLEASQSPVAECEVITPEQWARERLAFGLRLIDGVDVVRLSQETGQDLHGHCQAALSRMLDRGWLAQQGSVLKMTDSGLLFADSIAAEILSG